MNSRREQARKDLRDYDNPKGGKNINFQNKEYMLTLIIKYERDETQLRVWANEKARARK
jgi:hypothetical protein